MIATPPTPDPTMQHRIAQATVTLRRLDGAPLADAEVVVEQTRHAFAFGNIGFDFIGYANGETEAAPDSPFAAGVTERYGEKTQVSAFAGVATQLTEMDALVAYLQVLGTMVDFSTFTPDASR